MEKVCVPGEKLQHYHHCDPGMKSYKTFWLKEMPHEFNNFHVDDHFPNKL